LIDWLLVIIPRGFHLASKMLAKDRPRDGGQAFEFGDEGEAGGVWKAAKLAQV
jgi:hypothetical protein